MKNYLIVDDSANIRRFVYKTLQNIEAEIGKIFEAGDGEEALEIIKTHPVDVVLTDINMPRMDGIGLTRAIKGDAQTQHIKIIIISTEGSREQVLQSMLDGACGYLKKPFEPEEALEILAEALSQ